MYKMLPYGTRKDKDNEIKLFHGRRGRHLCWKRLEVFVCVRMVSAEASAQEMTAWINDQKVNKKKGRGFYRNQGIFHVPGLHPAALTQLQGAGVCLQGQRCVLLDDELVVLLQCIREHFGKPVYITSGYRTAAHNAAVGGSKSSQHLWAGRRISTSRVCRWLPSPPTPRPCCPPGAASGVTRRTPPTPSAALAGCISYPDGQELVADVKRR